MDIVPIKIDGKAINLQKAIKDPIFGSRNVLTNSRWEFVDLWLKKEKRNEAVFYWNQAREFNKAAKDLPIQASPLLHYYSFMNAAKALLSSKSIAFNHHHGVRSHTPPNRRKISLNSEQVEIKLHGILPSLSSYYGETEILRRHSLQQLFFNLPFIHRTYCLSYPSQKDLFIPLIECQFVKNRDTNESYFRAALSHDFSNRYTIQRLPASLIRDGVQNGKYYIRSVGSVQINNPNNLTDLEKSMLNVYHKNLRKDLLYINGSHTLWYAKSTVSGPGIINRFPTTITLAGMHRLSELCRYKPTELNSFLEGQKNWLISEFVQQSPDQFLDEIASEITGYQFLQPNIRSAS